MRPTKAPKFINQDELKTLWRMLERLQGDVTLRSDGVGWHWNAHEQEALVTVMDAVLDTYQMSFERPLEEQLEEPDKTTK